MSESHPTRRSSHYLVVHSFPERVDGVEVWTEIQQAVPQTYGEAVALWGTDVVSCEPHEWDNRTTEENAVWLLLRLHVRQLLENLKSSFPMESES